jgi:hypothetical protein
MDPSHMNRQNLIENDKNLIDQIDVIICLSRLFNDTL